VLRRSLVADPVYLGSAIVVGGSLGIQCALAGGVVVGSRSSFGRAPERQWHLLPASVLAAAKAGCTIKIGWLRAAPSLACGRPSLQAGAHKTLNAKMLGSGRQPMHLAAEGGHCDVINVLLDAGGSPTSKDALGITPYELAADQGHDAAAKARACFAQAVVYNSPCSKLLSADSARAVSANRASKGMCALESLTCPLLAAAARAQEVVGPT
jgi:hypothetical protein